MEPGYLWPMRAEQFTEPLADHAEGPVWSAAWNGLAWVDMLLGDVLFYDQDTHTITRRHVGTVAAMIRPRQDGGWVVALERSVLLETADGPSRELPELWSDPGVRMNDGACDPAGGAWFGSMGYDGAPGRGQLFRLTGNGVELMLDNVGISNGLDWSPDGSSAYYVDSLTGRIDVWNDLDVTTRRPFVEIAPEHGAPDGLCVDAESYVWVALWGGSAVHRYTPAGRLDGIVELPVPQVSACTFGGADLSELFVTTSAVGLSPNERAASGSVFRANVGVSGQSVRPFAG